MTSSDHLETLAQALEATGDYRVIRRLKPRPRIVPPPGTPLRLGLLLLVLCERVLLVGIVFILLVSIAAAKERAARGFSHQLLWDTQIMIEGFLGLLSDLHARHGGFIVRVRMLNQDSLESLFGRIRMACGDRFAAQAIGDDATHRADVLAVKGSF